MKRNILIPSLAFLLIQGTICFAQPANQSFNPADAAFVANPFSYYGIQYSQVAPIPGGGQQSISMNFPVEFAITNSDGSDIAMTFNLLNNGTTISGLADFRIKSLGQAFKLNSMEGDVGFGFATSATATITGYLAGSPVAGAMGTINFSLATATNGGISYTNKGGGKNGGLLTFNALWQNLDEIRITGTTLVFAADDLNFSPAVTGSMPVTLSAFDVLRKSTAVELSWRTVTEINNSHFIVQRSTDGGGLFRAIGKVAGNGNSTLPIDYTFTDQLPDPGANLYRLMQVDFDNTTTYSETKLVNMSVTGSVKVFPNPLTIGQHITIQTEISSPTPYSIVDIQGRVIIKGILPGNSLRVATSGMAKGTYTVQVNGIQPVVFQIR